MKIKSIKEINPSFGWCFKKGPYDEVLIKELNSGKDVAVEFIPPQAQGYVEEIKKEQKKKEIK